MSANLLFVLGGNDAEMVTGKAVLSLAGEKWIQPNVGWGDHVYSPADLGLEVVPEHEEMANRHGYSCPEKVDARAVGVSTVVFIECGPKDWPKGTPVVVIDHHGTRSGEPASVLQLLEVLNSRTRYNGSIYLGGESKHHQKVGFELSAATRRWVELIAANDAGYIPAMLALGATPDEVARIRALDRSAQGITPAHETEAERALANAEVKGRLTVVMLMHTKTATIADRLFGRCDQLLVASNNGEVNFYGDGALCAKLKEKFDGWSGGSGLGKTGQNAFWGVGEGNGNLAQEVISFITDHLKK
ncbi:MAG: hypothetical protein A3D44_01120 [Candidatus Staskawiczbacteria bacterium RIFCSPHIGHO2_02_FULL_42_22]|uniref:DHHA1 domain-containing protein n=1 Tax=Candidatus Staskawiczbacteria bacterium RIFCSPHIGHO2_02_FULL_42_22 TaxID=1802207 RepID=A0A1G2I369_9BACT|nr:MAG: hypothetical protein A3D44_01120 [Candidatus Staskawiczbacteria bacterium RIFCSPHIGHO2_02_FULL_42_22]